MTREELYTKAPGLMIPQPFAAGDASHLPSFTPILNEINGSDVNFIEGFTAAFSAPSSAGGRYVTREEMNAIGHLASANWFKLMCGGIFTFDADLATKIGGYPKGAILDYLDGLNYYRVVSLVDNNMVNFLGAEPTGTQQTIAGSVDGVNWQFCERGFVSEQSRDPIVVGQVPSNFEFTDFISTQPICSFRAQRSGILSVQGSCNITPDETSTHNKGFGIVAKENPSGGVFATQYDQIFSSGTYNVSSGSISYTNSMFKVLPVSEGQLYTCQLIGGGCSVKADLKIMIV